MFSKTIIQQSIKNNWKIWLTITITTALFLVLNIFLYEIKASEPQGNGPIINNVIDMLDVTFYGILGIILPMIFSIFVGNKLVATEVDSGTLSYYLNTPITRSQIIKSKAVTFVSSLILMFVLLSIIGIATSSIVGVTLDLELFLLLNLGLLLYQFAISGIVYLSSTYFNNASNAMAIGAGIPVLFFILAIIAGLDESLEFINMFSLNTLFDTANIIGGTNYIIQFIVMSGFGLVTYILSVIYFNKKDLPI